MSNLLNFDSTPYSDNLPSATTQLINQPDVVGSNVVISEESDLYQMGGKKTKPKSKSSSKPKSKPKSSSKSKSKPKSSSKPKPKSSSKPKPKPKSKPKSSSKPKPKPKSSTKPKSFKKEKEIDKYKRSQLEKIAKKNKVSLKKRDGSLKNKLELFKSLKRKNLL